MPPLGPCASTSRLMHAFMAGAREMNPNIRFQVSFIGSWFDPPKAKETAFAMIEGGADLRQRGLRADAVGRQAAPGHEEQAH